MRKYLLLLSIPVLLVGCARGGEKDPMEVWRDWRVDIEEDPVVSYVEAFPTKGGYMHLTLELDHDVIVANGVDTLDTGLTKEMCAESIFPVELWIKIPALDRNWYGEYDSEVDMFVISETFEGSHPDLTPEYRVETQTFILRLPSEG